MKFGTWLIFNNLYKKHSSALSYFGGLYFLGGFFITTYHNHLLSIFFIVSNFLVFGCSSSLLSFRIYLVKCLTYITKNRAIFDNFFFSVCLVHRPNKKQTIHCQIYADTHWVGCKRTDDTLTFSCRYFVAY